MECTFDVGWMFCRWTVHAWSICRDVYAHAHIYIYIYIFMQICIYIYIYTHIFACVLECTRRFKLKTVMHAYVKIYIYTFDFACVRIDIPVTKPSMLYGVDMWQSASLCITYTHRKTRTHVQSNCMLMHTLRLPEHGQMRAQSLLYTDMYCNPVTRTYSQTHA